MVETNPRYLTKCLGFVFTTIIDDLEGFQMCVAESVIELEDFDDLYMREAFDTLKGVLMGAGHRHPEHHPVSFSQHVLDV